MIGELGNSGSIPVLHAAMNFAARRHQLLASNIANFSTPNFVPLDVSVKGFQKQLGEAMDRRRDRTGSATGELQIKATSEVRQDATGRLVLRPSTPNDNIMFHDGNNRDVESQMQSMVENGTVYRLASDMLKARFDLLRSAISERA